MTNLSYVSDELTHFVGRSLPDRQSQYTLLREILRTGWLRASHRDQLGPGFAGQSDAGKALSGNDAIKCTSVCFCDIPVATLAIHMTKYSPFGVAFDKRILLQSGATPVHYVASNAKHCGVGVAPKTIGQWFDRFRQEIQSFSQDLGTYATSLDGSPRFLSKMSPSDTPSGHSLMGRFSSLQTDLEFLVFGQLKFFAVGLAADDPHNFYMEREWRVPEGFSFRLDDIARVIVPEGFVDQLRSELPSYTRQITIAEEDYGGG